MKQREDEEVENGYSDLFKENMSSHDLGGEGGR